MYLQPQPVARRMHELLVQPMRLQHIARRPIHRVRAHTRPHRVNRRQLRLQHGAVGLLILRVGLAQIDHTRHVTRIALTKRAHIDQQHAGSDRRRSRVRMRQRGARSRRDDRIERRPFRAQLSALIIDLRRQVRFGHAHLQPLQPPFQRPRIQVHRLADERDFPLILHHPQLLDEARNRHQFHARRQILLERFEFGDRQAIRLETDALHPGPRNLLKHGFRERPLRDADAAGGLLFRLHGIARVGEQLRVPVAEKQQRCIASREARQVTDIGQAANKQRIETRLIRLRLFQQCGGIVAAPGLHAFIGHSLSGGD